MNWMPGFNTRPTAAIIPSPRWLTVLCRATPRQSAPALPRFDFPAGVSWQTPVELGRAFAAFLGEHGVEARAIGAVALPADWLALRATMLPPTDDSRLLPGLIEFAADDLFAERLDELALTFQVAEVSKAEAPAAGASAQESGTGVPGGAGASIFACHRSRLDELQAMLTAAGINARFIVPLAAAVAQGLKLPSESLLLLQCGDIAELAVIEAGRVTWLSSLDLPAGQPEKWATALARLAMSLPTNGHRRLLALTDPAVARVAAQALHVELVAPVAQDGQAASARDSDEALATIAAQVFRARAAGLNFLTRRGPRSTRDWRLIVKRSALAALLVLALLGWFAYDWVNVRHQAAASQAQLDEMAHDAAMLTQIKAFTDATDPWSAARPDHLQALMALTSQFPEDGVIWLSSCEMEEGGRITLLGKARSRTAVLTLLANLESSGQFDHIAPSYVRQQSGGGGGASGGGGGDGQVTFAATCRHRQGVTP